MLWYSAMPHTTSEYNLEIYSPRDHRLQSTPVANSSSDCITSTLWFILGFFSHSDTPLDFAQFGSQSRPWWHYQLCSMVYSQEEFREHQLLVCEASKDTEQIHPPPLSYPCLPPSKEIIERSKIKSKEGVKHSRSSEPCLGPACSQSSHTEQSGHCTLLFRALLLLFQAAATTHWCSQCIKDPPCNVFQLFDWHGVSCSS